MSAEGYDCITTSSQVASVQAASELLGSVFKDCPVSIFS